MLKFTDDHEWLQIENGVATVGITAHASEQLGDVVFVELPEVGDTFEKGDAVATVESVKAASEVYAPLSGTITEVNSAVEEEPGSVNAEPQGKGWFFKIKLANASDADALLDEAAYKALIA